MRACPSCRREWPDGMESCPECLASLVADLGATIACPECGHVCPARMQACTSCLAFLRPGEVDLTEDVVRMVAHGMRMHRPAGRAPFESGPACSLLRLHPQSPLVLCGADGLIEANLAGPGILARPPLTCTTDGQILFRLQPYGAAARSVVAVGGDGAALGTYLRVGGLLDERIDVRDETSAPVARLVPEPGRPGFQIVETGGAVIGVVDRVDVEDDLRVDDQWSLSPVGGPAPLRPLALVALVVAAKVLLGRARPEQVREKPERDPDDPDDVLGPIGRTIVEGFLD